MVSQPIDSEYDYHTSSNDLKMTRSRLHLIGFKVSIPRDLWRIGLIRFKIKHEGKGKREATGYVSVQFILEGEIKVAGAKAHLNFHFLYKSLPSLSKVRPRLILQDNGRT
jgi:hypothetical protein